MQVDNYEDIINLPHHTSKKHPRMSLEARSAQFAPFAALTGYDEVLIETARLTNERIEIDETIKVIIDSKLQIIKEHIKEMLYGDSKQIKISSRLFQFLLDEGIVLWKNME